MPVLDGKTAIVTGAAQGLGAAFARRLAAEGANVTLFDLKENVLAVGEELKQHGHGVLARVADVSKRTDCEAIVRDTIAQFGGVDILVNNAGKWKQTPVTDPWEKALADFDEVMDTNVKGAMMMGRLCARQMVAQGRGGDIINISTYYVMPARGEGTNAPGTDCYNASKWCLNGFTDAWAQGLAQHNIRVNGLAMGATDTPMLRGLFAPGDPPADFAATWMKPEQIAGLLIDLMQDGRTGENIGAWVGHPVEVGPRKRWDVRLRERADFTGVPLRIYGAPPWDDAPEPVEHLVQGRPA
jgi:NAD(P)-dependent dehydrogenase (short-subunit alcohol dehydrogenase family)